MVPSRPAKAEAAPVPSILGVVPAAGRSTRMGNPKPLMDADGATFLDRTVAALREGGADPIIVGLRDDRGPIHAAARQTGAHTLVPEQVEDGPIATVRAALAWARDPDLQGLLLLPVDHPKVKGETVHRLVEAFLGADPRPSLAIPVHGDRSGHPVLFDASLFSELQEPGLPEGARTVVRRHRDRALEVPVDDRGILVDIDTLPEYRRHFPRAYRKRFQKW